MSISNQLDERDIRIVAECMAAVVNGDFFPEWEFDTLFGVSREAVRDVSSTWPNVDFSDQVTSGAIVGSLNNLLGYPHRREEDWQKYISVAPAEVKAVLDKLFALGL